MDQAAVWRLTPPTLDTAMAAGVRVRAAAERAARPGAMAGCVRYRIPVPVDGFVVSVAALAACPALRDRPHFAHRSSEPGPTAVLGALDADPSLELDTHLGEGSGAAIAVPLLQVACRLHNQMASFDSAGVSHAS